MANLFKNATFGFAIGILGLIVGMLPLGLAIEERIGLDLLFTLRGEKKPPDDVVIISLDKQSADFLKLSDDYSFRGVIKGPSQLIEEIKIKRAVYIIYAQGMSLKC